MLIDPELHQRIIATLTWMVADMRHRSDECRLNFEPKSKGGYSEELTEAINLLAELKKLLPIATLIPHCQLTEQQCRDQAVMVGMTEEWGSGYYNTYASQGWCKGNGVPITDVRLHMAKLRNEGVEYAEQQETTDVVRDSAGLTPRQRDKLENG